MRKTALILCALFVANVFAETFEEEKKPDLIKLSGKGIQNEGRTSELLVAYENDAQLTLLPYLSISNATVIISGNGEMDTYTLALTANQMQVFNIIDYEAGNYSVQIILPEGEVLSGDFIIEE